MKNERTSEDTQVLLAILVIVLGAVAIAWYGIRGGGVTTIPEKDIVSATVFPVYDITRNIAGSEVEVVLLLPPGASPHTYEPSPRALLDLQRSRVAYAAGHGLDDWVDGLLVTTGTEKRVVDDDVPLRTDDEDDHARGSVDPHYWLSVLNAMTMARTIATDLSSRFPDASDVFDRNLDVYLSRLRETHTAILESFDTEMPKHIVTLHDAWGYFADAYGVGIVGSFEPSPGREPTPRYLAGLISAMTDADTRTLFTEPQISTASLDAFLDDNGLTLATLDPLGGTEGRESYVEMMRYNASAIAGAQ